LNIVRKIALPPSMTYCSASPKIAITFPIPANTVAGESDSGHLLIMVSSRFEVPLLFVGLTVTAIMSVAMSTIATVITMRTIAWATQGQNDVGVTGGN
jgi:NitT/TauT family transport system permease protein